MKLKVFKSNELLYGYKDEDGKVVIPADYLAAGDFSEGKAPVRDFKTRLYGYINAKGEWVIKPQFDAVGIFFNGKTRVGVGTKSFSINAKGERTSDVAISRC